MSLEEARCAVVNAARQVRQSGMVDVRLDALWGALDALDAVGDAIITTTTAVFWCLDAECPAVVDVAGTYCPRHAIGPDTGRCTVAYCWRAPIQPGGVCHQHSAIAQKPYPFEQMARRAAVFDGGGE